MHQDFKVIPNIRKAYQTGEQAAHVEGVASGTDVDLTGERIGPTAIKSRADSLMRGIGDFWSGRESGGDTELGEVVELLVSPENQLVDKAKLDLLYAITMKGEKLGVSIRDQPIKAGMERAEGTVKLSTFDSNDDRKVGSTPACGR